MHNFNNGVVYYSHELPLTEDTYLENEIDRAITLYKKHAIDMFLLAKKVWCYVFILSPAICKACAEFNIGLMVYF